MWKKEKRITEVKYARNISFPEARKIVEQTQKKEQSGYAYVTKKENKEKEDTKQKQEELNKLINKVKNLIKILKNDPKRQSRNPFQQFQMNMSDTTKIKKNPLHKERRKSKLNQEL